jgi:predicted nucleotide-binding protein (sugar kinase/HSP70/actin superfamily)
MIRAWEGMIAVEVLNQLRTQCRPFERSRGAVDRAHRESLDDLDAAVVKGEIAACLQHSRERFQGATGPRDPERPQVAVVGDIFTRISPIANADLFRRIEALGCVVRTPPMFSDTLWHDGFGSVLRAVRRGEKKAAIQNALLFAIQTLTALRLQRWKGFGAGAGVNLRGWSWWTVDRRLKNRLTHDVDGTLALNINLGLEAIRSGADGVINAMCHNCMIGMVSDTLFKRLSEEPGSPPIATLSFDGLQETNTDTRLEALCERAHLRKRQKRNKVSQRIRLP